VEAGIAKAFFPGRTLVVSENDEVRPHPSHRPQEVVRHTYEGFVDGTQSGYQALTLPMGVQGGSPLQPFDTLVASDDDAHVDANSMTPTSERQTAPAGEIE